MPTTASLQVGNILFLPRKDLLQHINNPIPETELIDDGRYNHPILIFAVKGDKKHVLAFIVWVCSWYRCYY